LIETDDFDIVFNQKIIEDENIEKSTIVNVIFLDKIFSIKFNLSKNNLIDKWDLLFIEESSFLFFRDTYEWVAFDLNNKIIKRREKAFCLPCFEKKQKVIIVFDELDVKCIDFYGEIINEVPVDLPYELEEFEDKIEFESPVFGKQTLFFHKQQKTKIQTLTEQLRFF